MSKKQELISLIEDMNEKDLDKLIYLIKLKKTNNKDINIESTEEVKDIWNKSMILIKEELTEVSFNTWLKPIIPIDIEDETITLHVPNEFHLCIVRERYSKLIKTALHYVSDINFLLEYKVLK